MFCDGDRVIYSREGHTRSGNIGTVVGIHNKVTSRRGKDRVWYIVEWEDGYKGIRGYYQRNLSLYETPIPDWEV